ncbi:MAG: SDR family NAD(P)-dependent oxidoreductase [Saccharospirillaceae bacterium]|nr:SDR family NAD(P)-dependent oxidoreductase [Pseudomonadales bacterium]NRB77519.1 SDR family NAD(P)-dependent oxidoreductase [Saccharospirillaceae bacterium]
MFKIKGKTVLVTGANRGIGLAFVNALLEKGVNKIYAVGRDLTSLKDVVAINPNVIELIVCDVTNSEHIQNLTKKINHLDILINNAGIANACFNTADNAVEIAKKEMDTHYFGPMQITQACLPMLKGSKQAAIVNIASVAALSNFPSLGPYSATKAALMSFTQGLRIELAGDNIKAVCVYPGPTDTRLAPGDIPKAKPQSIAQNTLIALESGQLDIYPDDFSKSMFKQFEEGADTLAQAYAQMHG